MQVLVDCLVDRLGQVGVAIVPHEASALRRDGPAIVVEPAGQRFDGVVLAVPAPVASSLLGELSGESARGQLGGVSFSSVAVITLGFSGSSLEVAPDVSGVLVAPGEGLFMTACSFGSNKWPHWTASGQMVIRVSVGRDVDERWAALSDQDLVGKLCEELGTVLGQGTPTPVAHGWRVSRWPAALPRYDVGHLERVAAVKATLAREAPMVTLAGASYGGVGVPACIGSGRRAAIELSAAVQVLRAPAV